MKTFLRISILALLFGVSVGVSLAQSKPNYDAVCKQMITHDSPADSLHDNLIDDSFRIGDLIFLNGEQTGKAYEKARNQYGMNFFVGLTLTRKCSGSATIFVDPKNRSQDEVSAIYNKLVAYAALHLVAFELRPVDREVLTDGEAKY